MSKFFRFLFLVSYFGVALGTFTQTRLPFWSKACLGLGWPMTAGMIMGDYLNQNLPRMRHENIANGTE